GEQFGTPGGTSQYTYSDRILFKFMNIGSSSQNPHHAMEINQENPLIAQIAGIPGLGEVQAGQRGEALPVQEREAPVGPEGPAPVQMQQNQPEPQHIP
ncbi:unnamed protein product, partial [Prunus brigantina]